ncbi:MAG TPA: lipopolysaccharide kinase InaA family protein [Fimbriiglobus sp.]|nr:lipopolysaccharide kinase InaA family protein [Fimbriiglobus sp.]
MTVPAPTVVPTPPSGGFWHRLTRGRRVVHCEPDWADFAGPGWIDGIMAESVTDRYHAKQGRSIGRWTLTAPDGRTLVVYLKRHYVLPRLCGLLSALVPGRPWSPGLAEWEHLRWARSNGFPVPRAVAVGELLGPWGKLRSFLAVEELTGMLPLHEAVPLAQGRLSAADFARWKRGLVAELARLTRELHTRSAFHRDLYLCHFYVADADTRRVPESWPGRVWMIDFHRLAFRGRWRRWGSQVKDLAQLLYSTFDVPGVTARDRVRFWKLYREGCDYSMVERWVRSAAVAKARRYEGHNARHARAAE